MLDTQLILVEGLPGSGKSTFASFIATQAERSGVPVRWFHEVSQFHPTLFFRIACLTPAEYASLRIGQRQELAADDADYVRGQIACPSSPAQPKTPPP